MAGAGKTRFIRVNGRIVPIKDKDPSKSKMKKNYKKYGDGANQASRIDAKYAAKKYNASGAAKAVGFGSAMAAGGALLTRGKTSLKFALAAATGVVAANVLANRAGKKYDVQREREYVRTFGMDSQGNRPKKNKSGV